VTWAGAASIGAGRARGGDWAGTTAVPTVVPAAAGAVAVGAGTPAFGAGITTTVRFALEYSADAGVGVPRSPGRNAWPATGAGEMLGGVASNGADASCETGNGTRVSPTGLRPTSVAPGTAVIALGRSK